MGVIFLSSTCEKFWVERLEAASEEEEPESYFKQPFIEEPKY